MILLTLWRQDLSKDPSSLIQLVSLAILLRGPLSLAEVADGQPVPAGIPLGSGFADLQKVLSFLDPLHSPETFSNDKPLF